MNLSVGEERILLLLETAIEEVAVGQPNIREWAESLSLKIEAAIEDLVNVRLLEEARNGGH